MVNLAYIEEMAEEEMRKKRQRRQMLARQNASRSQRMPNIKEVITETDDDKPNKKVTTIDYSTILDEPPPEKGGLLSRLGDIFSGGDLSGQGSFIGEGMGGVDGRIASPMTTITGSRDQIGERFSPVAGVQGPEGLYPGLEHAGFESGHAGFDPAQFLESEISGRTRQPGERAPGYGGVQVVEPEEEVVRDEVIRRREGRGNVIVDKVVDDVVGLLGSPETEETLSGIEGEVLPATSNLIEEDVVRDTIEEPDFDPRVYDRYGEDIDGKEQRYLAALGDIYKKVAILNAVAALTNSPSQAGAFMEMASKKFKTLEGFRTERRMQKIGKGVFFTEDGTFDAPKTKQEAYERAIAFGASPDEAAAISGDIEETATATGSYTTWYNKDTGEERTFQPGSAPVDETGKPIEGWVKKPKPQGDARERLYADVDNLVRAGTLADAQQAYLRLKRHFSSMTDPITQRILHTTEGARKAAAQHLSDAYKFQNLPLPPGLQFGESGEAIFSTEGGERSEELIGKVTID
jgi:hypothetical protein